MWRCLPPPRVPAADKEYQAPAGNEEEENPEETLPATITLLVNSEQASF